VKKQKTACIEDNKKRGEWVELKFMAEAAERNLPTSKPYGDSENFDVVVGRPGKFVGVQVKSTVCREKTGYVCNVSSGSGNQAYTVGSFDFLAAYIVPENVWYIIPAKLILDKTAISLYPHSPATKYERYREAWELLRDAVAVKSEESLHTEEASLRVEESASPNRIESRMMGAFQFVRRQWER
jgi:hypothetical protein